MPIIVTSALTGTTVTLSESGEWSSDDKTLLSLARLTRLDIGEEFQSDPILARARAFVRMMPGLELRELDRPTREPLPKDAVP